MAGEGFARRHSLRHFCLRALLLLRHHYFSFVTAGVLIGIAVVAVRSSSYEERAPGATATRQPVDWAPVERKSFSTRGRSLIYYIVDSQEQASAIHLALRSDMVMSEMNGGRYDFGLVYYVQAGTPTEEGNVAKLLNTVVESVTSSGAFITIIDVRR